MEWLIGCVFLITIIAVYFPIAYIRTNKKVLKALEQIEANPKQPRQTFS